MGGRRHGLRCVTAPALDFGILTETKDSETATVESSFTVSRPTRPRISYRIREASFLPASRKISASRSHRRLQVSSMVKSRRCRGIGASRYGTTSHPTTYAALRTPIISSTGSRSFPSRSPMAARSTQTVETPSSMLFTGPSGKVATESYLCLPDVLIDIIETGASGNRSSFLI